jgi:hypothetical protein
VAHGSSASPTPPHAETLAEALVRLRYLGLYLRGDGSADAVRHAHGDAEFVALLRDTSAPAEARFLAAELWMEAHENSLPAGVDPAAVAALYTQAMHDNFTYAANAWGLPSEIGATGMRMLHLGPAAAPALLARFDDATPMFYAGSETATEGNRYQYRVKDEAAFLLSRVLELPYPLAVDPHVRDEEIVRLRALVPSPLPAR